MSEREYVVKCTEVIGISGNSIKIPDYIDLNSEIVRCRDCEYFDTKKCKSQWPFCLDAYCWWGKRKEVG